MFTFLIVGIVLLFGASTAIAYDFENKSFKGPNFSEERHEAMTEAFENADYDAWKTLMEDSKREAKILEIINEDNFAQFVEAHNLKMEGKHEEAKLIMEELGLDMEKKHGKMREGRCPHRQNEERQGGCKRMQNSEHTCPFAE